MTVTPYIGIAINNCVKTGNKITIRQIPQW